MKIIDKKYYPWVVVALLWVVALLNYMDRQMLSTMQVSMKADIHELNQAEAFGALMAVFLWVYGIVSPFAGMVADKVDRKWDMQQVSTSYIISGASWALVKPFISRQLCHSWPIGMKAKAVRWPSAST